MTDSPMGRGGARVIPLAVPAIQNPPPKPVLVFSSWAEEAVYARISPVKDIGKHEEDLVLLLAHCDRANELGVGETEIRAAIDSLIVGEWICRGDTSLFRTRFDRAIVCRYL